MFHAPPAQALLKQVLRLFVFAGLPTCSPVPVLFGLGVASAAVLIAAVAFLTTGLAAAIWTGVQCLHLFPTSTRHCPLFLTTLMMLSFPY